MAKAFQVEVIYNGASEGEHYQWKLSRNEFSMSLHYRDNPDQEWTQCDLREIPAEDFRIIAEGIQATLAISL